MTGVSPIQAALGRHRLAEIAARTGIALTAVSGTVTVRCPLPSHGHPDRTPSMRLYLDNDRYYCFGCAAKGDVIQWARDTETVGVTDAIRVLDSGRSLTNAWAATTFAAGGSNHPSRTDHAIPLSPVPGEHPEGPYAGRTPAERVLAALETAWDYYTSPGLHTRAGAYLTGRRINAAVLEAHTGRAETGHTPPRPDGLVTALRSGGFSDDELLDAGLARRHPHSRRLSDFYRQRVLIPVRDDQQRVIGIIGRNVGDQQRWAKYTNPPRTAVYDKSVNLYQPLPAPTHPSGQVIVVEGTLDAIAIATAAIRTGQADRYCPVTQSGRELSDNQIARIVALHPARPVLGFDGDEAGRESAARYESSFAALGREVIVSVLPPAHDPASWLALRGDAGLDAWSGDNVAAPGRRPVRRLKFAAVGARTARGVRRSPTSPMSPYPPPAVASGRDEGLVAL